MNKNNDKVPVAILSCFLIAFILQGVLKLCGILIFEKALDWGIFTTIDNSLILSTIYFAFIMFVVEYCLSFSLTTKAYSTKWYHYIILLTSAFVITYVRMFLTISANFNIFLDILAYIIVPIIINLTTQKDNRLFEKNSFELLITFSIQIFLYFCYLGLSYWSGVLNSMLAVKTEWLSSSTMFLIKFEVYIGLISFMLSTNILVKYIKKEK